MGLFHKDLKTQAPSPEEVQAALQEIKAIRAAHVARAGTLESKTLAIQRIKAEAEYQKQLAYHQLQMQATKMQYAATKQRTPQAYERHAVLHISGEKSDMLLDFDVQVHLNDAGEFESLIIATADSSVTILREEFLRRVNEGDMLCKIVFKRIMDVKFMDEKDKKQILRGDFLKQGKDLFIMQDGKLVKVDQ